MINWDHIDGVNTNLTYDEEAMRFKTISEFIYCLSHRAEIVIEWDGVEYGIFKDYETKRYYIGHDSPDTNVFYDTPAQVKQKVSSCPAENRRGLPKINRAVFQRPCYLLLRLLPRENPSDRQLLCFIQLIHFLRSQPELGYGDIFAGEQEVVGIVVTDADHISQFVPVVVGVETVAGLGLLGVV